LENVEYPEYETIVIGNNPHTDFKYLNRKGTKIKYIQAEVRESKWNAGIRECRNEIVVFIDENIIAHSNWLLSIAEAFKANTAAAAGLILPLRLYSKEDLDFELYSGAAKVFSPFSIDLKTDRNTRNFLKSVWEKETNIAFRKDFLLENRNYDLHHLSKETAAGQAPLPGYILKYEPGAYVKRNVKAASFHNGSFLYHLLNIRNFYNNTFKYGLIRTLIGFLKYWISGRVLRSINDLNPVVLFNVILDIKGLFHFYFIYKRSTDGFRDR
jgi:hypothetical protein